MHHDPHPLLSWFEAGRYHQARWLSADDRPAPRRIQLATEISADRALALAADRVGLLWRGDYHQARQLLDAMSRRLRPRPRPELGAAERFHRHRQYRARVAGLLGMVVVELDGGLALRRAPDVRAACREVYGELAEPRLVALRELLGVDNVHRQRTAGIPVAVLGGRRIHPHYGVFAPTRQDYLDLAASAPLPVRIGTAVDVGTGTGVLAALLCHRGVARVVATDTDPRAVRCAAENLTRLGLADRVEVQRRDLFPPGRADLVVANPPWLPGRPATGLERGVYDHHGAMTSRFLRAVPEHLRPGGEAWLILSDLAEHLGLRPAGWVETLVADVGLRVNGVLDVRPRTRPRPDEEFAVARGRERIQLWRLSQ